MNYIGQKFDSSQKSRLFCVSLGTYTKLSNLYTFLSPFLKTAISWNWVETRRLSCCALYKVVHVIQSGPIIKLPFHLIQGYPMNALHELTTVKQQLEAAEAAEAAEAVVTNC